MNEGLIMLIIFGCIPLFGIIILFIFLAWPRKKDKEVECPECLGDGRSEGWKIAFICTICNGKGRININHPMVLKEKHRAKRQLELNKNK